MTHKTNDRAVLDPATRDIAVSSVAFRVENVFVEDDKDILFPSKSAHNHCYITVDNYRRTLTWLYCPFQ